MDFLVHSHAAPGAGEPDPALTEAHWSYMDRFAAGMIARGPTLAADRATWTGSMHVVDLPGAAAARAFAEREPYHRAGLFARHDVWRFDDRLGRTMWEAPGGSEDPTFMAVARGPGAAALALPAVARERLIVHGGLHTPGEGSPAGLLLVLHAPAREAVAALLERGRPRDAQLDVVVQDWEPGGRR